MLRSLHIENFALIEAIDLNFENGFTVFTGETGSGKSILLGALNLILGERADYSVIRSAEKKTIVEANFLLKGDEFKVLFEQQDLDFDEACIIRREISAQGKSRAFINDTPVQLTVLKLVGERLIHIHSQHHTLELKSEEFQLDVLDYLCNTIDDRREFKQKYKEFKSLEKRKNAMQDSLHKLKQDADYVRFQLSELEGLRLNDLDYEALETELKVIEDFDHIKGSFEMLAHQLDDENELLSALISLKNTTQKSAASHPKLQEFASRLESACLDLKDVQAEANLTLDHLHADPERKNELENLLNQYNSCLSKHQRLDQAGLMELYEHYLAQDNQSQSLEEELNELEQQLLLKATNLKSIGQVLADKRRLEKVGVEQKIVRILAQLKMENSQFYFSLSPLEVANEHGYDALSILFSPNAGMEAKPIEKTASGGELSRLMLAIQLLLSEKKSLPSLIFDEIDTGVSGEVAQKLGEQLRLMGQHLQLMAITHLPQVAAKGNRHFKVSKSSHSDQTLTQVDLLDTKQRIEEIARLMSGENVLDSALEHAKELMGS